MPRPTLRNRFPQSRQKPYLTPNCMTRGVPAIVVTRPKTPEPKFVSVILPPWIGPAIGAPQLNVFSRLKVSTRSSSERLAPKGTSARQRQVDRPESRRPYAVPAEVAERPRRWQRECGRVQPVVRTLLVPVRIVEHLVDALVLNAAERAILARR